MSERPDLTSLTAAQQRAISNLLMEACVVRWVQLAAIIGGVYLAIFDGRGWPPVFIGFGLALWLQTKLLVRPEWVEKYRPKE